MSFTLRARCSAAALAALALGACAADASPSDPAVAPLVEVPSTVPPTAAAVPTSDDITPQLLARVVGAPPSTTAPPVTTAPPTTAEPVPEPPPSTAPEPSTTVPPEPEPPAEPAPAAGELEPARAPAPEPPAPEPPVTVPAVPGPWDTGAEATFAALVDEQRASAGLGPLGFDAGLQASARQQVVAMMANGGLFHQELQEELGWGWSIVGENVGYGPNATVIHKALVASPGHLANIVEARYHAVGIGVQVDASGRMWVAQVFGG